MLMYPSSAWEAGRGGDAQPNSQDQYAPVCTGGRGRSLSQVSVPVLTQSVFTLPATSRCMKMLVVFLTHLETGYTYLQKVRGALERSQVLELDHPHFLGPPNVLLPCSGPVPAVPRLSCGSCHVATLFLDAERVVPLACFTPAELSAPQYSPACLIYSYNFGQSQL